MIARITLSHSILGSQEISIPDGWEESVLSLERSDKFYSLIEEFDGKFVFYGSDGNGVDGGIDFIRSVLTTYGPDADLSILFELSFDEVVYETLFNGLLDLSMKQDIDDNTMQVPIIRNDFWSKFINRYETPVDLQTSSNIDGDAVTVYDQVNLNLYPQTIAKKTSYEGTETYSDDGGSGDKFSVIPIGLIQRLNEIEDTFVYLFYELSPGADISDFNIIEAKEDGDITITINGGMYMKSETIGSGFDTDQIFAISLRKNNDASTNVFVFQDTQSTQNYERTVAVNKTATASLVRNDLYYIYMTWQVHQTGEDGGDTHNFTIGLTDFNITITQASTVPATNAEGFLIHDAGSNICDRITGEENSFYSEYFGGQNTITRQYNSDGCGWNHALHKGLQIRQYSLLEKPFFMSFKQWWEGANPIFNLGLCYDTINSNEVIRVEQKKHFYSDDVSVNFSNVNNIRASFDNKMFFNVVEIGFKKWESEDISGIDDPQTKRSYSTRFKKAGNKIPLYSEFIAAGLAIETTRRTTREKSADYKYDNEVFIIVIRPYQIDVSPETSPDVIDYEPELAENFVTVDNVTNYVSRYNLVLTPARQLLRWLNYLSGCLQKYTSSFFKFASGEGNYDMTSVYEVQSPDCGIFDYNGNELSEKGDIAVSTNYLHLPDILTITDLPMTWEEYELIRDNREMAIGISQTNSGHIECYINTLKYSFLEGKADITCWPKTEFTIEIVEQEFIQNC